MPIATYPASLTYEVAWNSGPLQASPPQLFTDVGARVLRKWPTERGRQYELDRNEAGTWEPILDNRDGALDPSNPASPYAPDVVPYRPCRIRSQIGVNALSVDQATAGEGSGFLGPITAWTKLGVINDFGYPVTLITSGSAWQGTQVYQAVLASGAVQYSTVVMVQQVHVQPGQWYSFSAQAQVTAGNSPTCNCGLLYFDNNGNELAANGGAGVTLTAGAGTWTQLTVSAQAPAGAYSAWVKVETSGAAALTAATTFLVDGLQFEQSMTVTPWQMPQTISQNLFPQSIATGTQSIDPATDSAAKHFYPTTGSVSQENWLAPPAPGQTTALAWTTPIGTTSASPLYVGVAPSSAPSAIGPVQDITQVTAGSAYTASLYMSRTSSADGTVQVAVSFRWFDQYGDLLSTSTGTAVTVPALGAWIRGTCTGTAPANAAWARVRIAITTPASTTASNTVFCAGWQLEQASAATAWADPGPMAHIFTGFVEQYGQEWQLSGTWGALDAVAVDALGGLGVDQFQDPFIEEVLALGPTFLYTLNDPAGSSMVVDTSGNCPVGTLGAGPGGPGSLTLGAGISSVSAALSFDGTQGPVADFANTPSSGTQSAMAYIALPAAATTPNVGQSSGLGGNAAEWTRMIAFNCPAVSPAAPMYLWSATMNANLSPSPCEISFYIDTAGHLNIKVVCSASYTQTYSGSTYLDGNWHLASVSVDNVNGYPIFSVDGVTTAVTTAGSANPVNLSRDTIGGRIQDPAPSYTNGANASIALACQFPTVLTSAQITNLYGSFRNASAGESSGARIQRILTWIGWTGPTAIDTGATTDMGPASDLSGSSALDALNTVAATENGNFYVSAGGTMTFKARTARYNENSPVMIFGENAQWGEWPYEDVKLPTDPIHTYNDVQVAQYQAYSQYSFYTASQQTALAASVASQQLNFDRVLQKTINVASFSEAQEAAAYLLGQYQTPTMRSKGLKLNVAGIPGLFAACLRLEVGARIREMRRPPWRSTAIQFDGFVERISWELDPRGPASCTLECSPAIRGQYWTMGALWTTLNAQAASGQNQATVNALPDAALNALAASLPQGYQLTFDPGTQIAETLTLAPTGIPATNPGYAHAVLTFTTNFQYTHAANAVVTEPLPMGYTNPATWNANSTLGAGYAQFADAVGSGTQQIEIGPWTDAAANPLSADLTTGDLLWLSPGTANFEGYNRLPPNISTAGGGALPLAVGSTGASLGITGDLGSPTVTSSGTAYQGSTVWQVAVAANAATPSGLLYIQKAAATAGAPFTASMYTRSLTAATSPQVYLYVKYLSSAGANLGQTNGATTTLTGSATAGWTRASVTATAPAGTMWVQIGLVLAAGSPTVAWTWQADGLQLEQASSASAYQTCPQVASVVPGGLGASAVLVNLFAPLVDNHAAGDYVCDPLPAGLTSPLAAPGTARLAY